MKIKENYKNEYKESAPELYENVKDVYDSFIDFFLELVYN